MLDRKVLILVALAMLAVGIIACGQGLEPAPEPTPTLIPMSMEELSDVMLDCMVEDGEDNHEMMDDLASTLGIDPATLALWMFDPKYIIETRRWVQEHCLEHIDSKGQR